MEHRRCYWFAITANGTGAQFRSYALNGAPFPVGIFNVNNNSGANQKWFHSATSSTGGALPASITAPSPTAATNIEYEPTGTDSGGGDVPIFALTSY